MSTKTSTNGATETVVSQAIQLRPIELARMTVRVEGLTPLIQNAWSAKAKETIINQGTGIKEKKGPRDPEASYNDARYIINDEYDGIKAVAFKSAIVQAARLYDKSVTMRSLKQWLFVKGQGPDQLIPIIGERTRGEDMVRISMGKTDIRWRPYYWPWACDLEIEWVKSALTPDSVLALVNAAGIGGVGEWRPTAPMGDSGTFGRFQIAAS